MVRIAVCDDDASYLASKKRCFSRALKETEINCELTLFTSGKALIEEFSNRPYDIVILDIDMPEIDGKSVAQRLRVLNSSFFLVFITAYKSEVYNTIPHRINAFIPKDSPENYMISELTRVFKEYKDFKPEYEVFTVMAAGKKQTIKINVGNIFYFYCSTKTTYLVTNDKEYRLTTDRFSYIADSYLQQGFFETCRGYIVNICRVKMVENRKVILDNNVSVPLSRGRKALLLEELSRFISKEVHNRGNAGT